MFSLPINIIISIFVSVFLLMFGNASSNYLSDFSEYNTYGTDFVTSNKNIVVSNDTITSNRITKVWYSATEINVEIYQILKQQEITITVYNMLGKELLEIFRGTSSSRAEEVYSVTFNLPNGIYICVLQGKTFRDSEKFIISR
ncbi:MAG: T9SS type A sorting domain-containing protein [Candidatus Kapabacteria bacterium]|nr:T9SS type A sorting domain-containing protein [Candidatus Kapabacteria bacterium]